MANLDQIYDVDSRTAAFENHKSGVLISLAGPGTGKTHSLLKRIAAITKQGGTANSICYLTFIKEIGNAFIVDYIDTFGLESYEAIKPRISTLHSFACRLIRNHGFQIGYDGEIYFASITDSKASSSDIFLQDLFPLVATSTLHTVPQIRKTLDLIKAAWRDCIDSTSLGDPIPTVLTACLDLLHAYRLIDWDQTIPTAHDLFNRLREWPKWISQIEHFLVDEYQDFNRAEQGFITALSANAKTVVIVGDDDQSLYSSRGGSPDGLRKLYMSEECNQVSLLKCYRCKSRIVEAANTFLTAMRPDPRPMLPMKDGGEILCYCFKSTKAEIAYLATFLSRCVNELPENPKSEDGIVCLFPPTRNGKALDFYFDQPSSHLPCSRRRSTTHNLRSWLQQALELVCRPGQRFLERLILERYGFIKPRHKREMVQLILQRDISPVNALDVMITDGVLDEPAASQALAFCAFCRALESQDSALIAEQLSSPLGIGSDQLIQRLEDFLQCLDDTNQEEAISHLCDELVPDSVKPSEDPRSILFLTMHGAKGLTKKTVVMPGLEKAWLPGNATGGDLDEKKRLFYVALTRATDCVVITYPQRRARGDPLNYDTLGRGQGCSFIGQSGLDCIYHE